MTVSTHRLSRDVRFCINPFLETQEPGYNSFAANPAGRGLALFLELGIVLSHSVDPDTGFVVNVSEIDRTVRRDAVPVMAQYVSEQYCHGQHIDFGQVVQMVEQAGDILMRSFSPCTLEKLTLTLTPFKAIAMKPKHTGKIYFSEKFEFAAMHKLWNTRFTEEENYRAFGKCAHPSGHGHNYWVEVTVALDHADEFDSLGFEKLVDDHLIELLDHKNLNEDIPYFSDHIPTIENIAEFSWEQLIGHLGQDRLHCVTVWESDRASCAYYGASTPK